MITTNCSKCKKKHEIYFDENQLCELCHKDSLYKLAKEYNISSLLEESKLHKFKIFTYYCLFNLPILIFLNIKLGWWGQLSYCAGIIMAVTSYDFAKWCARKF
jgi:hypothetical protein